MGSAERRKQLKARKARQQAKKLAQRDARGQLELERIMADLSGQLHELVQAGRARIAITSIPEIRIVLAAMWNPDGVQVRAYDAKDLAALTALATAAEEHVEAEEWAHFIAHHLEAITDTAKRQYAISMIEWRPGEGPRALGPPAG